MTYKNKVDRDDSFEKELGGRMSAYRSITKWLIIVTVVVWIAWDVVAYLAGGVDSTISVVILLWSREAPIIPFLTGVVCGHLFWPITLRIS